MKKQKWGGQNKTPERTAVEDYLRQGGARTTYEIANATRLSTGDVQKVLYRLTADCAVARVPAFNEEAGLWRYSLIGVAGGSSRRSPICCVEPNVGKVTNPSQSNRMDGAPYLPDPAHVTAERMHHHRHAPSIVNGKRVYPTGAQA
jgi:hypothetical protein